MRFKIKNKLIVLICILFVVTSVIIVFNNLKQDISTLNGRELFINRIKPGAKIVSETNIEQYIISGFELSDSEYGLAVFAPNSNSYTFQSCVYSYSREYVNLPLNIGNNSYLIIWCNNPNIKQVQVKLNNQNDIELDSVNFNLSKQEIVICKTPFNNFSFEVLFYDEFGNIITNTPYTE